MSITTRIHYKVYGVCSLRHFGAAVSFPVSFNTLLRIPFDSRKDAEHWLCISNPAFDEIFKEAAIL